jgi:hypothetical protein
MFFYGYMGDPAARVHNCAGGAQPRTRLHTDQGDRGEEAIRVGEQVATLSVRGLLKRPSEIGRITAQAAAFDDAAVAMRVNEPSD